MNKISYKEYGAGNPVVLLHGFPMSSVIWDDFIPTLAKNCKVIAIDLPGFGGSELPSTSFSIDDIALILLEWIEKKGLNRIVLVGHSLGGYVALAMVSRNPGLFPGLILFHSTAFSDNPEKKDARNKVVEFVKKNGSPAFTSNFITPLFAAKDHPSIERIRTVAAQAASETVIGYTQAMRDRPDSTNVLKNYPGRILFLAGKQDPGIPLESIQKLAALNTRSDVHILEEQAHMGMVEAPVQTATIVNDFVTKVFFRE